MKLCPQCKSLMPVDVLLCLRCGHDSSKASYTEAASPGEPKTLKQRLSGAIRNINWLRVCAVVFTSKLFFLASCTAGMIGTGLLTVEDYGPPITETHPGTKLASVIATVPDTDKPGQRKAVVVFVSELDEFRAKSPDHSFLLSPGEGQVDNPAAEMRTKYTVTASGPGTVIVKSSFHHDVPPTGMDVRQRYEATGKTVKILNARFSPGYLEPLVIGLLLASALAITGKILRRRLAPATSSPSIPFWVRLSSVKSRPRAITYIVACIVLGGGFILFGVLAGILMFGVSWGFFFLLAAWWYWKVLKWMDANNSWKTSVSEQ